MDPTQVEIEEVSQELAYEVRMIWQATERLSQVGVSNDIGSLALMECILWHSRVLYDFFCGAPRGDDVSASHFAQWSYSAAVQAAPYLTSKQVNLNKSLAHLTFKRIEYRHLSVKEWDFSKVALEINSLWTMFQNALTAERQAWFARHQTSASAAYVPQSNLCGSTASPAPSKTTVHKLHTT